MAYNNLVADKVRQALTGKAAAEERRMFGALGFMVNSKLTICVRDNDVMYKLGPEHTSAALSANEAEPVTMGKRVVKSWVFVKNNHLESDNDFDKWLKAALDYNSSSQRVN